MRILLTKPDSFPPSSSWHQMLRKNVNVALVDYLYQGFYALNTLYGTCVTWEFWFTNEISKRRSEKCITNRAEWTSSSVLHCNVTVFCMTTRKYTRRRRGFITSWKIGGRWKPFSAEIFWSGQATSWYYSIFQYVTTRSSFCEKITEMTMSGLVLS